MYKNVWFWMIIMIVEQFYSMKNKVFLIALQQKSFSRGLRLTKRNCQTGIESKILTS